MVVMVLVKMELVNVWGEQWKEGRSMKGEKRRGKIKKKKKREKEGKGEGKKEREKRKGK